MRYASEDISKYRKNFNSFTNGEIDERATQAPTSTMNPKELESMFNTVKGLLPKFITTEKLGTKTEDDYIKFKETFYEFAGIGNLNTKIKNIIKNLDVSRAPSNIELKDIIKKLMLLETINGMLSSFNASTIGFMMEALLSAITGGEQIRIDAVTGETKKSISIVDAVIDGKQYSIKTLKDGTSPIKGSIAGLIRALNDGPVEYMIILKHGKPTEPTQLDFYSFTINDKNKEHFINTKQKRSWINQTEESERKEILNTLKSGESLSPEQRKAVSVYTNPSNPKYNIAFSDNIEDYKNRGALNESTESQFQYTLSQLETLGVRILPIGTLKLQGIDIMQQYEKYLVEIEKSIRPIYSALNTFNLTLFEYFNSKSKEQKEDASHKVIVASHQIPEKTKQAQLNKI